MGILVLGNDGNLIPSSLWLPSLLKVYNAHRGLKRLKNNRMTGESKEPTDVQGYFISGECRFCSGKYDVRILRRKAVPHDLWEHFLNHTAVPFCLILKYRYPEEYNVMLRDRVNYINVSKQGAGDMDDARSFPFGDDRTKTHDMVNLMDELLLVRELSLRVYDEILASGELKYYSTAMMAVKELRSVAETLGKFSLIAKQLERQGDVEKLPAPVLELIKEVASAGPKFDETMDSELTNSVGGNEVIVSPGGEIIEEMKLSEIRREYEKSLAEEEKSNDS